MRTCTTITVALTALAGFAAAGAAQAQIIGTVAEDGSQQQQTAPANGQQPPQGQQPNTGTAGSNVQNFETAAPSGGSNRFRIGPELGFYLPTSSATRETFGGTWFNYGIGFGNIPVPTRKGQFTATLSVSSYSRDNNSALLAPVTAGYRWGLGDSPSAMPYVGVSGVLGLADLESFQRNIDTGLRFTGGAAAVLGTTFQDRGYIQLRYLALTRVGGFDLSGVNFSTGFRF